MPGGAGVLPRPVAARSTTMRSESPRALVVVRCTATAAEGATAVGAPAASDAGDRPHVACTSGMEVLAVRPSPAPAAFPSTVGYRAVPGQHAPGCTERLVGAASATFQVVDRLAQRSAPRARLTTI